MNTFYARIIIQKGADFGLCLGTHNQWYAAQKAAEKDCKTHGYGSVVEIETATKLDKDQYYPELAQQYRNDRERERGIRMMIEVLNARAGHADINKVAETVALFDLTIEEIEAKYLDAAKERLEQEAIDRQRKAEEVARIGATRSQLEADQEAFSYTFPAVCGQQSGQAYFTAQVPFKALVRLFTFDEDTVPPELRAQRQLNETRAQKIAAYITGNFANGSGYTLPAITASVDEAMAFKPLMDTGMGQSLGSLSIPMSARICINDGQHRRRGIELAIKDIPPLGNETIAVTILFDKGLKRSQQVFADINSTSAKVSTAITMLYDHRDPFAVWIRSVLDREGMAQIKSRVDFERNSIGAKSSKLWSLIAFRKFIERCYGGSAKRAAIEGDQETLDFMAAEIEKFFGALNAVVCWEDMINFKIPACEVRENFVIAHSVMLEAFGVVAGLLHENQIDPTSLQAEFRKLPIAKNSPAWKGRCVTLNGKMNKSADGVKSSAAKILQLLGVVMPPDLAELHRRIESEYHNPEKMAS